MKTRNNVLVLVMALLVIAVVAGCSNSSKITNPLPADNQTGIVNVPNNSISSYFRDTLAFLSPSMYEDPLGDDRLLPQQVALYSASQWHGFSQSYRNQLILDKAKSENGIVIAPNCKAWATHIVSSSSGCVSLPSTSMPTICPKADGYTFCDGSVRMRLQNQCANPSAFVPGNVMQMWYGGTYKPHTAFIYSADGGGITFIDNNFVATGKVGIHRMSWTDFYKNVPAYTLYEVI